MSLQSPLRTYQSWLRNPLTSSFSRNCLRYASLNSAIGRGIRKSQRLGHPQASPNENRDRSRVERKPSRSRDANEREDRFKDSVTHLRRIRRSQSRDNRASPIDIARYERRPFEPRDHMKEREGRFRSSKIEIDEDKFIRTGNFRALAPEHQRFKSAQKSPNSHAAPTPNKSRSPPQTGLTPDSQQKQRLGKTKTVATHKATEQKPERVREHVKVPDTIPYTTPASEFIYGTAAVEAALRCSRRRLYKLYLYQAADEELSASKIVVRKLALSKNVKVKMAFAEWDRILDKMSAGRPHNGCILEASPLPRTPVKALKHPQLEDDHFRLELAPQTREEVLVNGMNDSVAINHSFPHQKRRRPIVLLLDGILDSGNLGAIIRSAYFLGVDAVVFAGRNSAPLSPVTIKSSAGAAENMRILDVKNEVDFIQRSRANGWRFYAADAPSSAPTYIDHASLHGNKTTATSDGEHSQDGLIGHSPSVIMMGSEGSGLSHHIRSHADFVVSIPGARLGSGLGVASDPARVDSLNVSVAAALLMETFLRVPLGVSAVSRKGSSKQ
ncbi:Alpha/beta knot methyltransferase [Aspergillus lucknowensis]|uniref:rRNA methyltransferase 1, mitochondrial n=1 Tax=Aspergillus lucknowensis TaxID=176173 RepID=A0ABR4LHK2_9EURO